MKVSGAITLVGLLADQQALAAPAGDPLRIDDLDNVATERRGTVFKTRDELLRASGSLWARREIQNFLSCGAPGDAASIKMINKLKSINFTVDDAVAKTEAPIRWIIKL